MPTHFFLLETIIMQTLAFPLRLQENGLLRRQDRMSSLIELLQVMARTPAGSWQGSATFGLRDLFESGRHRADVTRLAMQRINEVFVELKLDDFVVTEITRELSPQREVDTYVITIKSSVGDEIFTTTVTPQP